MESPGWAESAAGALDSVPPDDQSVPPRASAGPGIGQLAPPSAAITASTGPVTLDVPAQLGCPVPLVDRRVPAVLGADVPEAAVDENGHLPGRERYVGTDPRTVVQVKSVIFAEPVPLAVQGAAQG